MFTENNFTFQRRLGENGKVQNPARIPPQTPPAGGTGAEAGGKSISPVKCFVLPSPFIFLHWDFPQNTFELCLANTARNRNRILKPKLGRAEGATQRHSPRQIQNPKGFYTLRVARRLPIQFYE